jgi:Arc/MetJ-type ribon-helix-helix transcriptional regulator
MKRIPVIVPDDHHEQLRRLAFDKRSSISEEIRKAIAEYLERMREAKEEQS